MFIMKLSRFVFLILFSFNLLSARVNAEEPILEDSPTPTLSPTPLPSPFPTPTPAPGPVATPLPAERMSLLVNLLADLGELGAKKLKIKGVDRHTIQERIEWALNTANEHGFLLKGISVGRYKQMAFLASRQTGTEIQFFPDETNPDIWHLRKYSVKAWGAGVKIQFNGGLNIGLIFDWADPDQYQNRFCQADIAATTLVGLSASFKFNCSREDFDEIVHSIKDQHPHTAQDELLKKSTTQGEFSLARSKVILLGLSVGAGGGFSVSSPVHRLVGKDRSFNFSGIVFMRELLFQVIAEELELDEPTPEESSHSPKDSVLKQSD